MLTRGLVCVVAGLVAAATLIGARVAVADDVFGSVDCTQSATPVCDLAAGTLGGANSAPAVTPPSSAGGAGIDPRTGSAPMGEDCPDGRCRMLERKPGEQDASGGADVASALAQARQVATRQLRLPAAGISVNPVGTQLVNVPTWLWLSTGWALVSVSFTVAGVSMSAVATPRVATWSMGDGGTENCTGPGTAFRLGLDPNKPSPDCGHIYRGSSASQPGQRFPVTVTVHWTITWSGAGHAGTYPDMTTTGSTVVQVAEAQALVTGRCPSENPC